MPAWRRAAGWSFFFSSRRRHTRSYGDWSSDVCSSDLVADAVTVGVCDGWIGSPDSPGRAAEDALEFLQVRQSVTVGIQIGRASCRERVEIWGVAGARK